MGIIKRFLHTLLRIIILQIILLASAAFLIKLFQLVSS